MQITNKFEIGNIVYLVTDLEQLPRIVFGIHIYKGHIMYEVVHVNIVGLHYDFEMSKEKNILLKITSN